MRAVAAVHAPRGPLVALGVGGLAIGAVVALTGPALAIPGGPWPILALLAYVAAHALRIVRTLVVLGRSARSVRSVVAAHLASAAWTGLLPFKIGELARMGAIGAASDGLGHGLRVVWIERTFDAVLLAGAASAAIVLLPDATPLVAPVLGLSLGLLGFTVLAVVALPENLSMAKLWVMRRYTTDWSLTALRLLDRLGELLRGLRGLVAGRVATLAVLTVAIWACEVLGLWLLAPALGGLTEHLVVGMLAVLSDVLRPDGAAPLVAAWRTIVFVTLTAMAPLSLLPWLSRGSPGAPLRGR